MNDIRVYLIKYGVIVLTLFSLGLVLYLVIKKKFGKTDSEQRSEAVVESVKNVSKGSKKKLKGKYVSNPFDWREWEQKHLYPILATYGIKKVEFKNQTIKANDPRLVKFANEQLPIINTSSYQSVEKIDGTWNKLVQGVSDWFTLGFAGTTDGMERGVEVLQNFKSKLQIAWFCKQFYDKNKKDVRDILIKSLPQNEFANIEKIVNSKKTLL